MLKKILGTGICFLFFQMSYAQQGFFLNDFEARSASIPSTFVEVEKPTESASTFVNADFNEVVTPVSQYVFGNNANVYMTQMVDQPELLNHIKALSPNVIRYPGGNLSSVFFWNAAPGTPPADAPSTLVDASGAEIDPGYWYGMNDESWTLSVDNYYNMLRETGSTGIITVNYGYARYSTAQDPVAAAAHLAAEWVRYDNGKTKFWEIGNESNGTWQAGYRINTSNNKDGQPQIITGELYGKHFRVFADSMRKAAGETGATIYIGAQLLQEEPASWWNTTDKTWNTGVFEQAGNAPDFYIVHSYYTPYQTDSNPAEVMNSATTVTQNMMAYVTESMAEAGVDEKPVALTEWNIFAEGSKQQVSFINGIHSAIVLGESIKNKYGLACRWDLANSWNNGNDHGLFSNGGEAGIPRWHPRAPFYYMYYFQKYFGDQMIATTVSGSNDVLVYGSKYSSGEAAFVIINKGTSDQTIQVSIGNFGYGDRYYWHTLTGGTDNSPFSLKVFSNGEGPQLAYGGPVDPANVNSRSATIGEGIKLRAPARSANYILVEHGNNVITGTASEESKRIKVYPNPAHEDFSVELPTAGYYKAVITDPNGMQVFEKRINQTQHTIRFNTSLSAGIYTLTLYGHGTLFRRKLVIH